MLSVKYLHGQTVVTIVVAVIDAGAPKEMEVEVVAQHEAQVPSRYN